MTYQPKLDGVRGVAILAVLLVHCDALPHYFRGGWIGVDLFFVLSGYLISTILIEEYDRRKRINLKRFYWRRILRLYPALILCVILVGVFFPWIWPVASMRDYLGHKIYFKVAAAALFYAANLVDFNMTPLNHLWSLGVEEQFYIVWPLLFTGCILKCKPKARLGWVTVSIALAVSSRIFLCFNHGTWAHLYKWPWNRMDSLACGAWLALVRKLPTRISARFFLGLRWLLVPSTAFLAYVFLTQDNTEEWIVSFGLTLIAMAGVVLVAAALPEGGENDSALKRKINMLLIPASAVAVYAVIWVDKNPLWVNMIISLFLTAGFGFLLILNEGKKDGLWSGLLNIGILQWIGQRAYGIYLFHLPIFFAVGNLPFFAATGNPWMLAALVAMQFLLVLLVAALSYKYLEAPILAMKDRWSVTVKESE